MSRMKLPQYFADILIRDNKVGRIRREFFMICLKFQKKIIREWQNYKSGVYNAIGVSKKVNTHHAVLFLPWLRIPETIIVHDVRFLPWPQCVAKCLYDDDIRRQLEQLFASYWLHVHRTERLVTIADPTADIVSIENADRIDREEKHCNYTRSHLIKGIDTSTPH